jgi:hypothetical protein
MALSLRSDFIWVALKSFVHETEGTTPITLERETLHIMDDKQQVALIETKTVDVSVLVIEQPPTCSIRKRCGCQRRNSRSRKARRLRESGKHNLLLAPRVLRLSAQGVSSAWLQQLCDDSCPARLVGCPHASPDVAVEILVKRNAFAEVRI